MKTAETISTYCPDCDREVDAALSWSRRSLPVKGQDTEFDSLDATCPLCGGVIGDSRVEGGNLERAYAAYREANGLLSVADIKAIRSLYGLSLREFARFLGFGEQTVARYEAGAVQDRTHDLVIRSALTSEGAATLLSRNGDRLSPASRAAVASFVSAARTAGREAWNVVSFVSSPGRPPRVRGSAAGGRADAPAQQFALEM